MACDRRILSIESIGRVVTGKTPNTSVQKFFGGAVPFVTPTDFDGRRWIDATLRTLTQDGVDAVRSALIPSQAVMVTCIGSDFGKVAMNQLPSVTNQQINSVVVNEGIDSRYIYYNLLGRRNEIRALASGSAQPILNKSSFARIEVELPSLVQQKAIVDVLGGIDDRIDNLHQANVTLEAIAQAMFKSWFVDFDPVRANAEGREPEGLSGATALLFPSEFEDSELGPVPKSWQVSSIGAVTSVIDCLHAKKPELLDAGLPYLQLNCIREDGLLETKTAAYISESDYKRWTSRIEARAGDCVITNVGRVGAVAQVPAGFVAAIGRNMTAVRPNEGFSGTFLIELLMSAFMRREIEHKTDAGTILSALNVKSIPKLRFVRPSPELLEEFEVKCRPLRAAMEANLQKVNLLAELRDTLLPRLISGKLRLPEAEAAIEEAVA